MYWLTFISRFVGWINHYGPINGEKNDGSKKRPILHGYITMGRYEKGRPIFLAVVSNMNMKNIYKIATLIFLFLSIVIDSYSKTIYIPDDTKTIQEAISLSASGDSIKINSATAELMNVTSTHPVGRLMIKNKDISIIGNNANQRVKISASVFSIVDIGVEDPFSATYSGIVIDESHVRIENMEFADFQVNAYGSDHIPAPITALSGSLEIVNCYLSFPIIASTSLSIRDSQIFPFTYIMAFSAFDRQSLENLPAMTVKNAQSIALEIVNSTINCDWKYGYKSIVFSNVSDSNIFIENSMIKGGSYLNFIAGYRPVKKQNGSAGIQVLDSHRLFFNMSGSIISGGTGTYQGVTLHKNFYTNNQIDSEPSNGGAGIYLENSHDIHFQNGEIVGGNGMNGSYASQDPRDDFYYFINSGDGGDGIHLINSTAVVENIQSYGGQGGKGTEAVFEDGMDGLPIYLDELSTVTEGSRCDDWLLYR